MGKLYICTPSEKDEFIYLGYSNDLDITMSYRQEQLGKETNLIHKSNEFEDPKFVKRMVYEALLSDYGLYPGKKGKLVKVALCICEKLYEKANEAFK